MEEKPSVRIEVRQNSLAKKGGGWNLHIDSFFFRDLFGEPYASKGACTVYRG